MSAISAGGVIARVYWVGVLLDHGMSCPQWHVMEVCSLRAVMVAAQHWAGSRETLSPTRRPPLRSRSECWSCASRRAGEV